jgi:peroxiredoxin Q/BCP
MAKAKTPALKVGDPAPDVRLQTDAGDSFQLSALKGKNVVLYFYPRANTPGCTTEACEFRDAAVPLAGRDAVIIGVSPDASAAQSKFKAKYELPFTLLADVDGSAARAYGVWKEKNMYGRTLWGVERTTFLIGADGRIKKIFPKVRPLGHAVQVLEALSAL